MSQATLPFAEAPCPCQTEHRPRPPWTHRHHILPLSWGGTDSVDNVAPLCPAAHDWVHVMLREFTKTGDVVGRRRHWPEVPYSYAVAGWELWVRAGRPDRATLDGGL